MSSHDDLAVLASFSVKQHNISNGRRHRNWSFENGPMDNPLCRMAQHNCLSPNKKDSPVVMQRTQPSKPHTKVETEFRKPMTDSKRVVTLPYEKNGSGAPVPMDNNPVAYI